jgi:hypothetical protein
MEYKNARYIGEGIINCQINHTQYGWIPYTLHPDDTDGSVSNSELLEAMELAGDVAPYVPPTQSELDREVAEVVRAQRDELLVSEVDAIAGNALRWSDLSSEKQGEWREYRSALLSITKSEGFPHKVSWPVKPE